MRFRKVLLVERLDVDQPPFDEGFLWNHNAEHLRLVQALRSGKRGAVVEIAYCQKEQRDHFIAWVTCLVPGVKIAWVCFENDLVKANANCLKRTNKGDAERHLAINRALHSKYSYPDGADVRRIHEL